MPAVVRCDQIWPAPLHTPDIALARDLTQPISARSFEILGNAWAEYRDKLTEDFLIGMTVSNAPGTVANFSIDSSAAPLISFTDLSTNTPTTWHWDFDFNSDTSNLQNPNYTYTTNGLYNVCLTANNALGGTTVCKQVRISNIGVDEDFIDYKPFVYPNPSNGKAFIDMPQNISPNNLLVQFSTIHGQILNLNYSPNGRRFEFNTAQLPVGVYLFEIVVKDQNKSLAKGKFIVE